ncbi:hypothetical protein [Phocaeicola sartorii]|uniref:6-bladed beta-propeller n=1 Tax=Phocaeicola sartorii TaxID=671267 RepID=R9IC15_9BACT|nr:hypothetical protein [Phocaeicola sartorii]EOS15045.1 hypothetical protein C802_01062 [Phocaeicola sartorii]MCR1847519.1 hypothetical protein [Phocaeicola sartorii]NUL01168.1 hypothetical protein [Phocaeicola sartorii]
MKTFIYIFRCIIIVVLVVVMNSCSKRVVDDSISVLLEEQALSNAVPLEAHDVWYPFDSIYSNRFYVYADTILVVENKKAAGNFLDFYNIRNRNLIARKLPFGEGPGELLFAQMIYEGNVMRVTDYINRRLYNVEIDKVLSNSNYNPELASFSKSIIVTSAPVSYGDSILCINPFHYVHQQAGIDQQPPRIIAMTDKNPNPSIPMDFDYMTVNVGQGLLGANACLGKIFFASFDISSIEFYNSDLKLVKNVLGPVMLPETKLSISIDNNGKHDVCYKGMDQPEAYTGFTIFNDKLYFIYTGRSIIWDNVKDYYSYILCFDWNGNFLKSYSAPVRINTLSVSVSEPNVFYATIKDEENNPKLIKLTPTNTGE